MSASSTSLDCNTITVRGGQFGDCEYIAPGVNMGAQWTIRTSRGDAWKMDLATVLTDLDRDMAIRARFLHVDALHSILDRQRLALQDVERMMGPAAEGSMLRVKQLGSAASILTSQLRGITA